MSTQVDVQEMINQANSEVPSDQRVIAPEGDYPMYVKPGSTKIVEGEKDGRVWKKYTAIAVIDDVAVREATNLDQPTARVQFFLDVNENGTLLIGTNRNTTLGKLLKATGNDKPGWSYGSIEGVTFKGRVAHTQDRSDSERQYAEVRNFARA